MLGHDAFSEGAGNYAGPDIEDILNQFGFGSGGGGGGFGGFGDMFSEAFGGGSRRQPRQGGNLEVVQTISFMEAVTGVKKEISYTRKVACETCNGFGTKDGKKPPTCTACGGTGSVSISIKSIIEYIHLCIGIFIYLFLYLISKCHLKEECFLFNKLVDLVMVLEKKLLIHVEVVEVKELLLRL